ncbi:hypothetical protein J7T55_012837 [Diaporthe amygdali]|uniref:uncharacterized protein n=1 Tax=Phomopsis amygdali TaxID=1214568 RepID=UPI0022FECF2E|nr:uncharacterized protein J7T55_012837 [Diaporthe amygdali]KAJ0118585.1 hypothetical protein J7T55_012837 [Diaporthe amygdali]
MAIFTSDEGEGGTTAERVAVVGIICFSFSWIPVFIIWKLISIHRRRNRSLDQEIEAGNMPFQTNPSKPTRGSWRPPRPDPHSIEMTKFPQEPLSTVSRSDSLQKEYHGKRRPMPTQTTDPRIRKLPDIDDAAIEEQANKALRRIEVTQITRMDSGNAK